MSLKPAQYLVILVVEGLEVLLGAGSCLEYRFDDTFGTQVGDSFDEYFGPDMVFAVVSVGYWSGRLEQIAVPSADPVNGFERLNAASLTQVSIVQLDTNLGPDQPELATNVGGVSIEDNCRAPTQERIADTGRVHRSMDRPGWNEDHLDASGDNAHNVAELHSGDPCAGGDVIPGGLLMVPSG